MMRPSVVLQYFFLLCLLLSGTGCLLNEHGLNCGDPIDPDLKGCYKLASDETQYIAIVKGNTMLEAEHHVHPFDEADEGEDNCDQLVGKGRGILLDRGMTEWSFVGHVDSHGSATLTITLEGGDVEENTLTVLQSSDLSTLDIRENRYHNVQHRLLKREACP